MTYNRIVAIVTTIIACCIVQSCKLYSLSGVTIPENVKTYQVDFFNNQAAIIEPGIERTFTLELQEQILNQTSLDLVNKKGDYIYQGEITRYFIAPMTATADNTASQNRLTIEVNLRFTDTKNDKNSFERKFNFFYDYPATTQLTGGALDTALEIIYDQIVQDIINATLMKW